MITWIQKTFQQHFRIIFLVLLAGVIISFIFITNTSGGFGRGDYKAAKRPFFGLDLGNEQDYSLVVRDGTVSATLMYGGRIGDAVQFSFGRRAMLHTADQLRVPRPTDAEVKAHIQGLPIFMGSMGETGTMPAFNAELYNTIRQNPSLLGVTCTPGDFGRIIAEDARIAATTKLLAGPGYVLPAEVRQILKQADTTWTLQTATIERASFKTTITPTESDLTAYFDSHRATYTIRPRVRVSYAEIPAALHAAGITLTDAEVRAYYDANPARFPKPVAAAPASMAAPTTPDSDYNLVKPQVELALRQQRALDAANKAASDLAYKLYSDKITPGSPEFVRTLIQNNATINTAPDFSENDVPPQFGTNRPGIAREAFSLDADNRISNAINTGNGSVILFWEASIPAREPDFAEVRAQVETDCIAQETQRQFTELGQRLKTQIQDALKTGSTFEQAATKAATDAGVTATTKTIPPFTLRTATAETIDGNIAAALENLAQGDLSDMGIVSGDGRFVYAQTCQLPDLTEANPDYTLFATQIATRNAMTAIGQYQQNLVDAELAKSAPVTR
jgi:peptidyl-prolyl cis-trans isomerase D